MLLDERLYLSKLFVSQCTLLLHDSAAVTAYKQLCGGAFGQPGIAGMDMHAFDDAEGGIVQIVPANFTMKAPLP